jgi:hypothetical protein
LVRLSNLFYSDGDGVPPITAVLADDSY